MEARIAMVRGGGFEMPATAWYDTATGLTIPFGKEWDWEDPPEDPAWMEEMRDKIVNDWHTANPFTFTASRLLQSPRQLVIEAYVDYPVAPESISQMYTGTVMHARLAARRKQRGMLVGEEARATGKLFGTVVSAEPDAVWFEHDTTIPSGLIEDKFTSASSLATILRESVPKKDHVFQVNVQRRLVAQRYQIDPTELDCQIRYRCMPQKENVKHLGGWTRMPPFMPFRVPLWSEDQMAEYTPAWDPPTKPEHSAIPTTTVASTIAIMSVVHAKMAQAKADGNEKETLSMILSNLECECPRRFNGKGREFCERARACAMADHGSPIWG